MLAAMDWNAPTDDPRPRRPTGRGDRRVGGLRRRAAAAAAAGLRFVWSRAVASDAGRVAGRAVHGRRPAVFFHGRHSTERSRSHPAAGERISLVPAVALGAERERGAAAAAALVF